MTSNATAKSSPNRRLVYFAVALAMGVAAVGLLVSWLAGASAPSHAAPIQARLELAAGKVVLITNGNREPLISGTPLLENAELETGPAARALVRLPDGGKAFLRGGTRVALAPGSVTLYEGEYWLDAPPTERKPIIHRHGKVEVAASDAGLSLSAKGERVVVYVARGMALVSSSEGRVEVHAGERAELGAGQPPKVTAVAFWQDWTGGMADFDSGMELSTPGSGSLYGVDEQRRGEKPSRLEIARQSVRAAVRQGLSETEVDQSFFNPADHAVEGWYWFTIPSGASITSFAVETNGNLVEGEFVERQKAAAGYGQAKASGQSPAILEWIDRDTYRARIYPVPASGSRRIVVRYIELTPVFEGRLSYVYPMGAGSPVRVGEFALTADLGDEGPKMKLTTLAEAQVEEGGKRVTLRRSGYTPRAPFQLEAFVPNDRKPLRVARFEAGDDRADFIMARYVPDIDWMKLSAPPGDVVVVVDTSAAGDDSERQLKVTVAEAILRALSSGDHFALVSLDARATVLHPSGGLAEAKEPEIAQALTALANHPSGGATDLAALFDVALARLHKRPQPAVIYIGDGVATSGIIAPEPLLERLRHALGTSRARLFTVGVGSEADHSLLRELARVGGGSAVRIDRAEQATSKALELTAQLKTPTLTDLEIDLGAGLDEPFLSTEGPLSRGQEVILLARTHHDLPKEAKVSFQLAGKTETRSYAIEADTSVATAFVPRLWASEQIRRLLGSERGIEAERGKVAALGIEYGLMTPFTSVLALESEAAYQEMGISRRRSPLRGVTLTKLEPAEERRLSTRLAAWATPLGVGFGCKSDEEAAPPLPNAAAAVPPKLVAPAVANESAATATAAADFAPSEKKAEGERLSAPGAAVAPRQSLGGAERTSRSRSIVDSFGNDEQVEAYAAKSAASEPTTRATEATCQCSPSDPLCQCAGAAKPGPSNSESPAQRWRRAAAATAKCRCPSGDEQCECLGGKKQAASHDTTAEGLQRPPATAAKPAFPSKPLPPVRLPPSLAVCSDAAARPLWDRAVLWRQRLRAVTDETGLIERYESAWRACEMQDWQSERVFLILMQRYVKAASGARLVLEHFASRPEVQKYVAKLILRRSADPGLSAAIRSVLFGSAVDWLNLDLELQTLREPKLRVAKLRQVVAGAPDDPQGTMRLVRALIEDNQADAAVALSRQLRDDGLVTPSLARDLGDVLARAGLEDESARTYSEIVEFDAEDQASRRLLGDVYLSHGWYDRAYRQYATLTEAAPTDALAWLRLAAAASGAGRIDEALRLERRVASLQGSPGPEDPRRWARLASAARLARLLSGGPSSSSAGTPPPAAVERELRELQLFGGPGVLVLLAWENLFADLSLVTLKDGDETQLGQNTDAAPVGLYAVLLAPADATAATYAARLRSVPEDRALPFERLIVAWDGKRFDVKRRQEKLEAGAEELAL